MQFVSVKYRPGDTRSYTFHNDGPPVAVGDTVRVDGRDGWQAVLAVAVTDQKPAFQTKAIAPWRAPEVKP